MEAAVQALAGVDAVLVYALLAVLVFGESASVAAAVLPGELALLVAGALAGRGEVSLPLVVLVAAAAAIGGQGAAYALGRRYGERLLRLPGLRGRTGAIEAGAALVARHGGLAVLLGRFSNVGRIAVPLLVGAGGMRPRTFALYNVVGGVAWTLAFVSLGAAAGVSVDEVEHLVGRASWALAAGVAATALAWRWRRRRRRDAAVAAAAGEERGTVELTGATREGEGA